MTRMRAVHQGRHASAWCRYPKTLWLQVVATQAAIAGHPLVFVNPKRIARRVAVVPMLGAVVRKVAYSLRQALRPNDLTRVAMQVAAAQALMAGQPVIFVNPAGGQTASVEQ